MRLSRSQTRSIAAAISQLKGIRPADELEGMLAAQAVATHSAAMECLRRATLPGQSIEGRDMNLRHAAKLSNTYTRQIEVLDKHRGKGQQQVTVEIRQCGVRRAGSGRQRPVRRAATQPEGPGRCASCPPQSVGQTSSRWTRSNQKRSPPCGGRRPSGR